MAVDSVVVWGFRSAVVKDTETWRCFVGNGSFETSRTIDPAPQYHIREQPESTIDSLLNKTIIPSLPLLIRLSPLFSSFTAVLPSQFNSASWIQHKWLRRKHRVNIIISAANVPQVLREMQIHSVRYVYLTAVDPSCLQCVPRSSIQPSQTATYASHVVRPEVTHVSGLRCIQT
jgi:hypothetical protein